ncbi:hypothetical protein IHE55_22315 [Streptomyces pactum]|uniref:Gliding motility protein n=1 Tax=Streptomyces pactum TaxID=68249 RepID=A0ABS0NQ66_9ACTN|nr:hypothetical protein [Streptomyces pactum]MBH5337343.1 hypothetical protein [Streptomyces pactum]
MGVFSRFRRRKAEASTEEAATVAQKDDSAAAAVDSEPAPADRADAEPAPASEGVGIPKQQGADEAADNETGEDARA